MSMAKIELMHHLFGKDTEHTCKDCSNIVKHTKNRSYYKCSAYGETESEATDWRLKYQACGFYNKPYDWIPVIEYKKHMSRKQVTQTEGQMRLFE